MVVPSYTLFRPAAPTVNAAGVIVTVMGAESFAS